MGLLCSLRVGIVETDFLQGQSTFTHKLHAHISIIREEGTNQSTWAWQGACWESQCLGLPAGSSQGIAARRGGVVRTEH